MTARSTDTLLIKLYGGGRLYDTQGACYVTLDDIATIVLARQSVTIVEAASGRDVTQAVLADIGAGRQ